jgi:hypothetical protein
MRSLVPASNDTMLDRVRHRQYRAQDNLRARRIAPSLGCQGRRRAMLNPCHQAFGCTPAAR